MAMTDDQLEEMRELKDDTLDEIKRERLDAVGMDLQCAMDCESAEDLVANIAEAISSTETLLKELKAAATTARRLLAADEA